MDANKNIDFYLVEDFYAHAHFKRNIRKTRNLKDNALMKHCLYNG
jgi:hypothetical protein